jgi:hypothetical protein
MIIALASPLPLEECLARLTAAIDREGFEKFLLDSKPVIGRIKGNWISLRKRNWYSYWTRRMEVAARYSVA